MKRAFQPLILSRFEKGTFMLRTLLLAGATALAVASAGHAETYAIQAGHLIVDAAQAARGASTVIVENGRIARIESGFTAPAGAIVVDERSRTVLPGMTDVHVHLTDTSGQPWYQGFTQKESVPYRTTMGLTHALEMAQAGFTTVRDLGGDTSGVIAVRAAVAEGRFPGPRIAATNAGIDSIEHGTFLDESGARAMKAHGTYYSATLMAFSGVSSLLGTGKLTPAMEAKTRQTLGVWGKGLNLAYRTGVKIALGTDSAVAPHAQAGKELELMVTKGGMSPRDALIAATKGGPDLMNLSNETGTLDPGKSADLIAVDGDPLVDPTAVQRVGYVMVEGKPIPMKGQ